MERVGLTRGAGARPPAAYERDAPDRSDGDAERLREPWLGRVGDERARNLLGLDVEIRVEVVGPRVEVDVAMGPDRAE
jgi:hypothetical protein